MIGSAKWNAEGSAESFEGIERFKATPEIAFALLDLTMPRMDGEQCFRELRQLKPDVKVIMSSGCDDYGVARACG